jgi:hypothetical protein
MPDTMTQLVKEFLEVHGYIVSTSIKMGKSKQNSNTESDVDIIAYRYKWPNENKKYYDTSLKNYIIGEVKSTYNGVDKSYFKEINESKFKAWNSKLVKRYVPQSKKQNILFCYSTTEGAIKQAKKQKIKIITATHMLTILAKIIINKSSKRYTYYIERPIYSTLRMLLYLLSEKSEEKYIPLNNILLDSKKFFDNKENKKFLVEALGAHKGIKDYVARDLEKDIIKELVERDKVPWIMKEAIIPNLNKTQKKSTIKILKNVLKQIQKN